MLKQTFYRQDSSKNIREWNIETIPGANGSYDIIINAGVMGGSMINTVTNISAGKGKKTIQEQANFDAQSEINKKVKGGYVDDITKIKTKGETATIKAPMKGDKYHPKKKNKGLTLDDLGIRGKMIGIQRKLDGWRYRVHLTRTKATFYTSSGDLTLSFPHIEKELVASFNKIYDYVNDKYGIEEYYLDGEIYRHNIQKIKINPTEYISVNGKSTSGEDLFKIFNNH